MTWLWVAGMLTPFGVASPILFGMAGAQTRKRSWIVAAVIYGILSWGGCAVAIASPDDSSGSTLGGLLILCAWIAAPVHAFFARPEYKRRLTGHDPVQEARKVVEQRREAQRLAKSEPAVARQLGIGRPDIAAARDMGVVDLNHAAADTIAELPGVNRRLAREIVRCREEIDGFSSLEDMGGVLGLDADLVEDLRDYVVFIPR